MTDKIKTPKIVFFDIDGTLTFVGDYRICSKCKMLKSVIWLQ